MRITQVRDDGKVNTLRTLRIEQLVELMKVETKAQPVSKMREVLPYMLPGDKNDYVQKVPKLLPAAAFVRKNGVMVMAEYNGIVMIQVNNLSGPMEADEVKKWVKELPQTYLAFVGSSGKSVKIWVRFTYPDDLLPVTREQAELFHAHAYRLAVKFYQPQLPFHIELKEPSLEQYCRLTFDPELYFNPESMPIYMKQPASMPGETTYREQVQTEASPLQRLAPDMKVMKRFPFCSKRLLRGRWRNRRNFSRTEIYIRCWLPLRDIVSVQVFPKRIRYGGRALIITCRRMIF